jgi:hypothetical protein
MGTCSEDAPSNIIDDFVIVEINYCASILLYEFILSSEFSLA